MCGQSTLSCEEVLVMLLCDGCVAGIPLRFELFQYASASLRGVQRRHTHLLRNYVLIDIKERYKVLGRTTAIGNKDMVIYLHLTANSTVPSPTVC